MKQILLAEDEERTRRSLTTLLESAGFKVDEATNGLKAIEKLLFAQAGPKRIDLLVTDIFMPVMTGLELIDIVKKQFPSLPIVVITGYRDERLNVQLSQLGCPVSIDKPFEPDTLLKKVSKAFEYG